MPEDTGWLECEECGEYQTPHKDPCVHCGAENKHLILRKDDDSDASQSAYFRKHPERFKGD